MKEPSSSICSARTLFKHSLGLGLLLATSHTTLHAQTPGWQPNRLNNSTSMQPLNSNAATANTAVNTAVVNTAADPNNSGVVLRWRTSARVNNGGQANTQNTFGASQSSSASSQATINSGRSPASSSLAARVFEANSPTANATTTNSIGSAGSPPSTSSSPAVVRSSSYGTASGAATGNPLRSAVVTAAGSQPSQPSQPSQATQGKFVPRGTSSAQRSAVQPANYQAQSGNAQPGFAPPVPRANNLPGGNIAPPNIQGLGDPVPPAPTTPEPPSNFPPSNFPPNNFPQNPAQDALNLPEDAPAPPVTPPTPDLGTPPAEDPNSANMPQPNNELRLQDNEGKDEPSAKDDDGTNPFKNRNNEELESPSDRESARRSRELEQKKDSPDSSANCESFRDKLRNSTIQKINLNAAPRYGQGMNDDPVKAEKQRLDFAASSEVRDWCDRRGNTLIQGRMIDLINEQVVLDINGVRREIPLRDLCDVDLAYVGKVWHLPITCGSGYEQVAGRSFEPSAIQWKASGLCHKPLYFEEVQLERYGHEIGPILQPLVSTAHFFGNIAVLPYKMGIHPPHECQYSLGYYRPGDCAPYMLPPVPISLRGAAAQAGVVIGGAALVP